MEAVMKEAEFMQLECVQPCSFKTNIWTHLKFSGTLGGFANESGVNKFIDLALQDVLGAAGLSETVRLVMESEVLSIRPDWRVLYLNGYLVGVIEGKQPGKQAMTHPRILGEVYDQLMHLRSVFRVSTPFAILSSYNQWRLCWLDDAPSNMLAAMTELPESTPYQTPSKRKRDDASKLPDAKRSKHAAAGDTPTSRRRRELTPPPTPSSAVKPVRLSDPQGEEDGPAEGPDDEEKHEERILCVSPVVGSDSEDLPVILLSVFTKMTLIKTHKVKHEAGLMVSERLRLANATGFSWKKATYPNGLDFGSFIGAGVTNFFFWEELGRGASGKVYLVSGGAKGSVGVIKFFFNDKKAAAKSEQEWWGKVYGHLPGVAKVRTVELMGQTALLMPWFAPPTLDKVTLDAVERTLKEDYHKKGLVHEDVAWRNIGVYNSEEGIQAVAYDMGNLRPVNEDESDKWVATAVERLRTKL
jgi:hypothetical protein